MLVADVVMVFVGVMNTGDAVVDSAVALAAARGLMIPRDLSSGRYLR